MIEISKAVINSKGRFLLLKRRDDSQTYLKTWDFPGGKHDEGETPRQSVIRETKEETGYDIEPGSEIKRERYRDSEQEFLFHYFIPQEVCDEVWLSSDHSDSMWATPEEMKEFLLHPSVRAYFLFD